jgi:hypothetical protein
MARLTPARLNVGESVLSELFDADGLTEAQRRAFGNALDVLLDMKQAAITAKPNDHQPVMYAPGIMGCSCGVKPQRVQRMSQTATFFFSHRGKLGIPEHNRIDPVIRYGEHNGKRYSEVYR